MAIDRDEGINEGGVIPSSNPSAEITTLFMNIRILIIKLTVMYDCLKMDCASFQSLITNYQDNLERDDTFVPPSDVRGQLLNGCVSHFPRLLERFGLRPIRYGQTIQEKLSVMSAILDELTNIQSHFIHNILPDLEEINQWMFEIRRLNITGELSPVFIPEILRRSHFILQQLTQTLTDLRASF